MTEFAVAVTGVSKVFPSPFRRQPIVAVRDLNLRVAPGQIYGLLGPNGSGKSTTMKVILGLVSPTRGKAQIFGHDTSQAASRQEVGFLPESPYFYKYLTGKETLQFYGRLCGVRRRSLRNRIDELLHLVGLTEARDRRLHGYSKGMLQRIGLAQALIHQPRLVVLDEPTAGVDPAGAREIQNLILNLKQNGVTVLLSSHLLGQMQEICDRVGILAGGVLVREGPLDQLLAIENRTDLSFENASPIFLNEIETTATRFGARLIKQSRSQISLERYFLTVTQGSTPGEVP
jgi:ABC-2 type transport system ATP-binding protein